jgi:hypothetical protein
MQCYKKHYRDIGIQVVTHAGSVRTRTESMERLERAAAAAGSNTTALGRAVENTYSFV